MNYQLLGIEILMHIPFSINQLILLYKYSPRAKSISPVGPGAKIFERCMVMLKVALLLEQ